MGKQGLDGRDRIGREGWEGRNGKGEMGWQEWEGRDGEVCEFKENCGRRKSRFFVQNLIARIFVIRFRISESNNNSFLMD